MRKISKVLAIAATVVAVGGGSAIAVAQTAGPSGYGPMGHGMMGFMHGPVGYRPMGGWGRAGFADPSARLDALKTELNIRPEQTAAWDAYVKAVDDAATQMRQLRGSIDFEKLHSMSWNDHLAYMGQLHDRQAAAFKSVQVAATSLLAALDDTQKSHVLLPRLENFGPGIMGGDPWMMGHGYEMMDWDTDTR